MRFPLRRLALFLAGGFLLLAVSVTILGGVAKRKFASEWKPLASRLPTEIEGWRAEELPLAETEQVRNAVVEHLNYDDYIYRRYTNGSDSVYIYAMFWRQGRISVREMSGHTPDGCWIANGASYAGDKQQRSLHLSDRDTALGEVRSFTFPGTTQIVHVIWWHLWGDERVPASFNSRSISTVAHEIWLWLWKRKGRPADQVFVRIHGFRPAEDYSGNPVVRRFLTLFPQIVPPEAS